MGVPTLTVPGFSYPPGQGPAEPNPVANAVVATGLGLATAALAYGAVTATGVGILTLGVAPLAVGGTLAGGVLAVGAFLKALEQLKEWGIVNWRPSPVIGPLEPGDEYTVSTGSETTIRIRFNEKVTRTNVTSCSTGINFGTVEVLNSNNQTAFFNGVGIVVGRTAFTDTAVCGTGPGTGGVGELVYGIRRADGSLVAARGASGGAVIPTTNQSWTQTTIYSIRDLIVAGVVVVPEKATTSAFADAVRARIKEPEVLPEVPQLPAPATPVPAVPVLPPAPDRRPLLPPVPIPRPGQVPAPAPSPGTMPTVRPGPGPAAVPGQPAPGRLTATGVAALPGRTVTVTAPGTTFLPGGVALPDNGPPPTMQGVATELGKIERKLEIAIAPEGPLSLLQQINRAIDQIENIRFALDALFPEQPYQFPAGSYQLAPVCDRDADGVLLPAREAAWAGGQGEVAEVRRKVDALALLLQHHKDLKQPTCGGRGSGPSSNVTVHFESD